MGIKRCKECGSWKKFNCPVTPFTVQVVNSQDLFDELLKLQQPDKSNQKKWVFRGQLSSDSLCTTLERACNRSDIKPEERKIAEQNMVREFQRWYNGENRQDVRERLLYCISLMQHHMAPTRLLDWTYSPYVAMYFGLQYAYDENKPFSVWALDPSLLSEKAIKRVEELPNSMKLHSKHYEMCEKKQCEFIPDSLDRNLYKDRERDKCRDCDFSFRDLYWSEKPIKIVCPENAYRFHSRLYAQQGVFLCLGDVTSNFEKNLISTIGENKNGVIKFCCADSTQENRQAALDRLRDMNIHRATLFDDLDGFGYHLWYRINYFKNPLRWGVQIANK